MLSKPLVLEHRYLQTLTLEPGVQVGVDGPSHALQHQQVHTLTGHFLGQLELKMLITGYKYQFQYIVRSVVMNAMM